MQSPFMQPQPQAMPIVIKPLVYCEFRVAEATEGYGQTPDVSMCAVFASEVIEEMAFCFQHGQIIQAALFAEGGGNGGS